MKTYFKHVSIGEKFIHNQIEYTRTNFNRGKRQISGQIHFRNFKSTTIVETKEILDDTNIWRQIKCS